MKNAMTINGNHRSQGASDLSLANMPTDLLSKFPSPRHPETRGQSGGGGL